jgi:hypothetical protein
VQRSHILVGVSCCNVGHIFFHLQQHLSMKFEVATYINYISRFFFIVLYYLLVFSWYLGYFKKMLQ